MITNQNIVIIGGKVIETIDGVTHYENVSINNDLHKKLYLYLCSTLQNTTINYLTINKENTKQSIIKIQQAITLHNPQLVVLLVNSPTIKPANTTENKLKIKNNNLVAFNVQNNINIENTLTSKFVNTTFITYCNLQQKFITVNNNISQTYYNNIIDFLNSNNKNNSTNYSYKNITLNNNSILKNKKIVITAGRTLDIITNHKDALSNFATGTQGVEIAIELANLGAEIVLIAGIVDVELPINPNIKIINTVSSTEMYNKVLNNLDCFCFISNAAVNDFETNELATIDLQNDNNYNIYLKPTIDILHSVGNNANRPELVIGFAAETNENMIKEYATNKLTKKNCNLIVANIVGKIISQIGVNNNKVFFINPKNIIEYGIITKQQVAKLIGEYIIKNI